MRISMAATLVAAGLSGVAMIGNVQAQQAGPPPAVLVQQAVLAPLAAQLEFIGRASAANKVELRARVSGTLGPRKFTDGDMVLEGQPLFLIEPGPYQAAVDQRLAQRDSAQAALANADLALKRAAELLRTNAGTQATYDQRLSEQLQAKAQLEDARAKLRDAEIQFSYTEIKSPIAGRIGRAAVSPGNVVSSESGVLATVVAEDPMRVLFQVTQRELLEARRDTSSKDNPVVVRLKLADGSLYKEKGKLDFIDVTVDTRTDGQTVRAVFPNTDKVLTDGQTLRVTIEQEKVAAVVTVPQSALALDQSGAYLFVVNDKNAVEQRHVRTGVSRNGLIAIEAGVKEGEKVVIQGQQRVRPGMTVNPTMAPPTAAAKKG